MSLVRRDFLKMGVTGPMALASSSAVVGAVVDRPVRIAVVGTGNRGRSLLRILLGFEGVEVPALCDIQREHLDRAGAMVVDTGRERPEAYGADEHSYRQVMEREDIDAVIIATYWEWHAPMAVYGMKMGKYVAVEVPIAYTLEECWDLVKTHEETGVPCMMLENWSFRRDNLAVLNMIRKGLLGDTVHCHCAHSHDCIDHWFFESETGEDRWGAKYLLYHNRDQYPTHQLGPVISWMDIGTGDYFDYITSTATGSFGINDYFLRKFGPDHPNAQREYAQGDIVTTVVRTKKGKSIVINYDMQLPRPYDNRWMIQGTRGIYNEQRDAVYLTGRSPEYHEWEPFGQYQEEFDHSWWKALRDRTGQFSHGGTDYLELKLFLDAVSSGTETPLDVYDGVAMSVHGPLSERSISRGGVPVRVPDFTGGGWKRRKPRFGIETTA
jgi:predicted dehydrogenase